MKKCILLLTSFLLFSNLNATITCSFTAVNDMNFGNYDVFDPIDKDVKRNLKIKCTSNSIYNEFKVINVNLSSGSSGYYSNRTMYDGSNILNYNLYRNNARSILWYDRTNGTKNYRKKIKVKKNRGFKKRLKIFGRIPALQDASNGYYTDSIVVEIIY